MTVWILFNKLFMNSSFQNVCFSTRTWSLFKLSRDCLIVISGGTTPKLPQLLIMKYVIVFIISSNFSGWYLVTWITDLPVMIRQFDTQSVSASHHRIFLSLCSADKKRVNIPLFYCLTVILFVINNVWQRANAL